MLKPRREWPPSPSSAKVFVNSDEEWERIARGLLDYDICTLLPLEDVHQWGGKHLLNGLFGVSKGETNDRGVEALRVIMNLIPINEICNPAYGDIEKLPFIHQWNNLYLLEDEAAILHSEDLRCMFYLFAMPPETWRYMAFNRLVPQHMVPGNDPRPHVLASRVLGMGWVSR